MWHQVASTQVHNLIALACCLTATSLTCTNTDLLSITHPGYYFSEISLNIFWHFHSKKHIWNIFKMVAILLCLNVFMLKKYEFYSASQTEMSQQVWKLSCPKLKLNFATSPPPTNFWWLVNCWFTWKLPSQMLPFPSVIINRPSCTQLCK